MIVLGIETSCDETAASVVEGGKTLSNVVSSSVHLHKKYGGVVPEIASRYHLEFIYEVVKNALTGSRKLIEDIDLISVTQGPGLCGSLLTGISYAKTLSYAAEKPLIGVNHVIAHLYANFLDRDEDHMPAYPFLGLVISGGHTNIYLCDSADKVTLLGRTQDDAVGEAFDKVAKLLNLGYPGGPVIEKMAGLYAGPDKIKFPRAYLDKGSLDFSFSGVKTAVLYYLKNKKLTTKMTHEISYSFQEAVFDVICDKVVSACKKTGVRRVLAGGGVACNRTFVKKLEAASSENDIELYVPPKAFCLDNAAMIAYLGGLLFNKGFRSKIDITANINMEEVAWCR